MERFKSLGVITDKAISDRNTVVNLITILEQSFESENCTKADIVKVISSYLPNFEHIETGTSLDEKM